MKPFFILSLLCLISCGAKKSNSISYGQSSVKDLIAEKGDPLSTEKIPVKDSSVLVYPNHERYQVTSDVVTYKFRSPMEEEKPLLYWKHRFKDCVTRTQKVIGGKDNHLPGDLELLCDEEGMSVTYTEGSSFVSGVIEYAKK